MDKRNGNRKSIRSDIEDDNRLQADSRQAFAILQE